MVKRVCSRWLAVLLVWAPLVQHGWSAAAQVAVRHTEGDVHGFFVVKTMQGRTLADGDMTQVAHGDRVTTRLMIQFKDGSVHDETAVFSERHSFRLLNYHLVQKGPDLTQVAHGDRVTTRLMIQFKDGSVHDETAVFSERHSFRLLNYHLVQKG